MLVAEIAYIPELLGQVEVSRDGWRDPFASIALACTLGTCGHLRDREHAMIAVREAHRMWERYGPVGDRQEQVVKIGDLHLKNTPKLANRLHRVLEAQLGPFGLVEITEGGLLLLTTYLTGTEIEQVLTTRKHAPLLVHQGVAPMNRADMARVSVEPGRLDSLFWAWQDASGPEESPTDPA